MALQIPHRRAGRRRRSGLALAATALWLASCGGGVDAPAVAPPADGLAEAGEWSLAPLDLGAGPGRPPALQAAPRRRAFGLRAQAAEGEVPVGPPEAGEQGFFGPAFAWPIIAIHQVLLPDGRVLSYGSTPGGLQSGLLHYSIWTPSLGTGAEAFQLLDNRTGTDIFCAGQALLPGSGDVLIVGGDRLVNGRRNYANRDVNLFLSASGRLERQSPSMEAQRWYATVVTDARGQQIVLGGRDDRFFEGNDTDPPTQNSFAPTPEVFQQGVGWRSLSRAASDFAYGSKAMSWFYPRAWSAPDGRIAVISPAGWVYALNPAGAGRISRLDARLQPSLSSLPSVMFSPGQVLSLREAAQAQTVDLRSVPPLVAPAGRLSQDRQYGSATLLADGRVWVNGGSSTGNDLKGAAYASELWTPPAGPWTEAAAAAKARLYHSTSMLLPDGSVITAGGGAPGPVRQLNAERYYPPYLYRRDGSGLPAARPGLLSVPEQWHWGELADLTVQPAEAPVARVSLVRFGAVTHVINSDQRFLSLPFTAEGTHLKVSAPSSAADAPPGFYLVFVIDGLGVPSLGRVVRLG